MNATEYGDWVTYHRGLFAMKADDDQAMFQAWFPSLREFTLDEARSASLAVASDSSRASRFRSEHLALIRQQIFARRLAAHRALADAQDRQAGERDCCKICRDYGYISVPHQRAMADGYWSGGAEIAVACRCPRGAAKLNSLNSAVNERAEKYRKTPVRIMSIDEYEFAHPDWQTLMQERVEQRKSEDVGRWYASKADKENPILPANVQAEVKRLTAQIGG